jgi:hypothetical protein
VNDIEPEVRVKLLPLVALRLMEPPFPEPAPLAETTPPPVKVRDPLAVMAMFPPLPEMGVEVIAPTGLKVKLPVLAIVMAPPAPVIAPLFAKVEPFTFIVNPFKDETVTALFILVFADVVVVTGPPLKTIPVLPDPAALANVNCCPAAGVIAILPPVVENDAVAESGAVSVRAVPDVQLIAEALVALIALPAPRLKLGLLKLKELPPPIPTVWPPATVIVPVLVVVADTVPPLPALRV